MLLINVDCYIYLENELNGSCEMKCNGLILGWLLSEGKGVFKWMRK